MRRTIATGLLVAVTMAAAASHPFTFVVLGDRTGGARPAVFQQIMSEIGLLHPNFIVCTGDLIEGHADDAATNAQWDTITAQLRSTGIPYFIAPGNHDISSAAGEVVFTKRIGAPAHELKRGNSVFIFLDNSRWPVAESLPATELGWLDKELAQARKSRHVFVVMHRPYWRDALDQGRPELLHSKFKAAGVDYVFTGHDHFYCSYTWDGIRYFQVGPSGSGLAVHADPGAGAFQNYLLCRVDDDTVMVTVREPGKNNPLPVDTVTYESVHALELAKEKGVVINALTVPFAGPVAASLPLTVNNATAAALNCRLVWRDSLTAWRVEPRVITVSIAPLGRVVHNYGVSLMNPDSLYPLPAFAIPYEYAPGRKTTITRSLPIRREAMLVRAPKRPVLDGRLTDACWQDKPTLRAFGSRTGGSSPMEATAIWVARDDSLLYVAARCDESAMAGLKADIATRDGKVYEDDNLSLLLDFSHSTLSPPDGEGATYYQVFVNPAGTIADRKCWFEAGQSRKDYAWNGNWQVATRRGANYWTVEMSCPLSDFGVVGETWGVNANRFQSRTQEVAVWQVPFEHTPDGFGLLRPLN